MATTYSDRDAHLQPDDAFAVLGNAIRMEILQTLGEANEPVSFSELRDRVGVRDSGQFHYHLDKLDGHFIVNRSGEYTIRQPGRRVVQAVLSGAVTEAPIVDRTEIDMTCPYCDGPVEVQYVSERVEAYCTECAGTRSQSAREAESTDRWDMGAGGESNADGYIGGVPLPPAGVQERTPLEIAEAGVTWGNLQILAGASAICPHCSARLDVSPSVCTEHDASDGFCDRCNSRHAVRRKFRCTNCIYRGSGVVSLYLREDPDLLAFQLDHGLNPVNIGDISSYVEMLLDYDEEVRSTNPLSAAFTFSLDDDAITLTVDDELNVVRVTESRARDAD